MVKAIDPCPETATETVLVIDNDPVAVEWLKRKLVREGLRVVTATNGEEGLRCARAQQPLAIFLDVVMPGMDGWAVLGALKGDPALRAIPVVMVTMMDDRNKGAALGVMDYLMKPVDSKRLSVLIQQFPRKAPARSVLVVEDDSTNREMLARLLRKRGWQVAEAENGQVALQKIAAALPEVIVLDLMMPVMDGPTFVRELRKLPGGGNVPILVLTAKDLTDGERQKLGGSVRKIFQKGGCSCDDLLREMYA